MSQILSEYCVKTLFNCPNILKITRHSIPNITTPHIVKVDQQIKSRGKKGLLKICNTSNDIIKFINQEHCLKYNTFIAEPVINIDKEDYVCFVQSDLHDTVYIGINCGGIDFTDVSLCKKYELSFYELFDDNDYDSTFINTINKLLSFYRKYHFTFMEINPLVNNQPLDFAVKFDTQAMYLFSQEEQEILKNGMLKEPETFIEELDKKSGSSLKFNLLNENGSIWTMVAGGGASVLYTDCIVNMGLLNELANYGEYSGNPNENELTQYSDYIINLMLQSQTNKQMYLILGGGISNFTDVSVTFKGIINSIVKYSQQIQEKRIKILIRRGGINCSNALENINNTCNKLNIDCKVYSDDTHITGFLHENIEHTNYKKELINVNVNINDIITYTPPKLMIQDICTNNSQILICNLNEAAIQRMLDYEYSSGKEHTSIKAIHFSGEQKNLKVFFGPKEIMIPIFDSYDHIFNNYPNINIVLNFYSYRSIFNSSINVLSYDSVKLLIILAENVPIRLTKILKAMNGNKIIIGGSSIGALFVDTLRLGNAMGSIENINKQGLYSKGTVGLVTKSGGLLNEMSNIINKKVHTAIAIGGDRYPCTRLADIVYMYNQNDEIKSIVVLGEVGGVQELEIGHLYLNKICTKPLIIWSYGTSLDEILNTKEIQFGHMGSYIDGIYESSMMKNHLLSKINNIYVPHSFEKINELINKHCLSQEIIKPQTYSIPYNFNELMKNKMLRMPTMFTNTITDERNELKYNNICISEYIKSENMIGKTICNLLFKLSFSDYFYKFIEYCIVLLADHGICPSTGHTAAVMTRAGQNLSGTVASSLLGVTDKHGGAIHACVKYFYDAIYINKYSPDEFIKTMRKENIKIPGIGHLFKSTSNKDARIDHLHNYINTNFVNIDALIYAKKVESILLTKKDNLILNVDGYIACAIICEFIGCNKESDLVEYIKLNDYFNSLFIISRTIGLCAIYGDQKRIGDNIFRFPTYAVMY